MAPPPPEDRPGPAPLDSTAELLARVREGDERALERLVAIYRPLLCRWAHGRLPAGARGLADTEDIVQVTLVRVLNQMDGFEARRPGAFLAYLRRACLNNLRNEIRSASRRPAGNATLPELPDPGPSPLEEAIGRRAVEAYEAALEHLTEEQRAAVVLRIEMGCKHQEVAELLGSPSANAARMLVCRGLARLAELMREETDDHEP